MNVAVIQSVARHVLTAAGGILVTLGLATPEEVATGGNAIVEVVGGAAILFGFVWGVWDKVKK
jgi:hypothetical protein